MNLSKWLAQWSPSIIAIFLVLVSATGIISVLFGRVRDFVFGKAIGSLVEAATAKASDRDHKLRGSERQAALDEEQKRRVADAIDKLTEALNAYVTVVMSGLRGAHLAPHVESAHRALGVLERDGPQGLLGRLAEIKDIIDAENSLRRTRVYSEPINRTWVNLQITAINTAVRG